MKRLSDIISTLLLHAVHGETDRMVSDLVLDSRLVVQDSLFCALSGLQTDGHRFIAPAIERGATVILCENLPTDLMDGVTYLVSQNIRTDLGKIAAAFFGHPSAQLKVIGVTGTNGKTSIATWLYELAGLLGYPAGLLSTVRIMVAGQEHQSTHTTPDVITINRYLKMMVDAGCSYAFMEVSSHALVQQRTAGIEFAGAIFTNLTRDHLDYHPDFRDYLNAKKLLFDHLTPKSFALVNADDRNGLIMTQNTKARVQTYATRSMADFRARIVEQHPEGMLLSLANHELWVPVIGEYNALNLLAVFSTGMLLGFSESEILTAMSRLKPVEGRLEIVALGKQIIGVVDYAHTPDALTNVLGALNEVKRAGTQIITVIGAGGDRDPGKRPLMARAALEKSDRVILTSDNPRTENPEKILDDMESGVHPDENTRVLRITDRLSAIKTAVALARSGDIILVAGKGHENYQEIKGVKHHFDDVEELEKLKAKE